MRLWPSAPAQTPIMRQLEPRFGEDMGEVRNVGDSEFNDTISNNEWVIVDFGRLGVRTKAIGPVLQAVADERDILVARWNADAHQATAAQLGVRSIPALFIYRNGTMVSNKTGVPKPKLLMD